MAIVSHRHLEEWMGKTSEAGLPGCILVGGEDFLVQQTFDKLKTLLIKNSSSFHLDILDGRSTPMVDIIEQVTTFSLLAGKKIIAVRHAPVFATTAKTGEIVYSQNDFSRLSNLVENGIPDDHILVITASSLDRRRKIFKALDTSGVIIDCTVSRGARKADLDDQRSVLQDIAKKILGRSGKTIDHNAFSSLVDRTGFDLDLFAQNLEKLIAYCAHRRQIATTDVQAIIRRDKKDPVFSLTNALLDKDAGQALFYLSSLFADGFHPLQILKSFENQVRKMLLVKAFLENYSRSHPDIPFARMNFNMFTQQILPAVTAHDTRVKKQIESRQAILAGCGDTPPKKQAKKTPVSSDLLLAPNPQSPYPVFQIFDKSTKFSLHELCHALIALGDLDFALKSSSMEAVGGLENFVIVFCQKGGWSNAAKNQNNCHHF
jgi:DNA polymerase III delta subunit